MARGELAFIVKEELKYMERDDLSLWIKGKVKIFSIEEEINDNLKVIICLVNRPPGSSPQESLIENFMDRLRCVHDMQCVIMGDFNFNLFNCNGFNLDFFKLYDFA